VVKTSMHASVNCSDHVLFTGFKIRDDDDGLAAVLVIG
jgi:hypothetical protein